MDRLLGVAVHAALARWQRAVDGGASPRPDRLVELVRQETGARGVQAEGETWRRVEAGLRAYAAGPWPKRTTLFLEHAIRHVVQGEGFAVELHLRVDRVVRYQRSVAILDFKVISPHAFELAADEWQLQTYALAAPELLGVQPTSVHLFVVDIQAAVDHPVNADAAALKSASGRLLDGARGIAADDFDLSSGHDDRPCWACGFRLSCPSSLARDKV